MEFIEDKQGELQILVEEDICIDAEGFCCRFPELVQVIWHVIAHQSRDKCGTERPTSSREVSHDAPFVKGNPGGGSKNTHVSSWSFLESEINLEITVSCLHWNDKNFDTRLS
ncbi:hypothetical protein GCM10017711_21910 [Paeniglutamicibacter sulfureus]